MSLGYNYVSFLDSVKDLIILIEVPAESHHYALNCIVRLKQIYGTLSGALSLLITFLTVGALSDAGKTGNRDRFCWSDHGRPYG